MPRFRKARLPTFEVRFTDTRGQARIHCNLAAADEAAAEARVRSYGHVQSIESITRNQGR